MERHAANAAFAIISRPISGALFDQGRSDREEARVVTAAVPKRQGNQFELEKYMADLIEASSAPAKPVREEPTADLSAEIIKSVEKWPEDRVTCRRIGANSYRCNWWSAAD